MSYDSPNNLVNSILSLAITKSIPQDNIPKDIVNEVKSLFPQKISYLQIQKVKNLMSKGTFCFEAVAQSNISFPFKPDLLVQLIMYTNFIEKEPNISSAIILFSFLTWCVNHYNNNESDYLSILFEVLKTLAINCRQPNIRLITISSIYNLLSMVIPKKLDNIDFSAKVEIIDGIFTSISNLPSYFYDIFVKAAYIVVDNSQSNLLTTTQFIKLVVNAIKQYPDKFPQKVIDILAPLIAQQVSSYNKPILEYVSEVSQLYGLDAVQSFLPVILLLFSSQIKENSTFPEANTFTCDAKKIQLADRTGDLIQNKGVAPHPADLIGHFDFNSMPVQFSNTEKLIDIISPNLKSFLLFIISEFKGKVDLVSHLVNLSTYLFVDDGEYSQSYDGFAFFIVFISNLYTTCKFEVPSEIIFHNTIFDPMFTVFKQEKNWTIVNTLRNRVIEFLIYSMNDKLYTFIADNCKYPLLFSELLYRISSFIENINANPNFVNIYYNMLLESNNYYQNLSNLDDEEINHVKKARFAIFYILNKLNQSNNIIDHLFANERFMSVYSTFIFEESLIPLVFTAICNFSKRTLITEDSVFNQSINNVLREAAKHFDNQDCLSKCNMFLSTINDFIINDDNLLQMFERSIASLCSCLILLPNTKMADSFLLASILFLTLETKFHHLRSIESSQLEAAIIQIAGPNPSSNYFDSLIHLAAGSSIATIDQAFNVEQPKAFRILLHVFSDPSHLIEIINFIGYLCKKSETNTKKFHDEGIDIDLLEIILSYREIDPDEQTKKIVNEILSLFTYIENHSSSVVVVEKFIQLFCLVNGHYLPWFHELTIDTFINLIKTTKEEETTLVPFDHSSSFQVINIKNEIISHGFTFCCWIFSSMSLFDYVEHLITIYDKKGQEISIFHNFSSILISTTNQNPVEAEFLLISHEWTLVSISFRTMKSSENEYFVMSIYNNDLLVKELTIPSVKFEKNNHFLNCTLCGTSEDSVDIEMPSASSQFAIYPYLDASQIKALTQLGCNLWDLGYNPHFVLIPTKPFDTICLKNVVPNSQVTCVTEIVSHSPTLFSDVFINKCGVDLILPIFAQWGLTFQNEEEMVDLPEKSVIILSESLLRSEEAQRTFDEGHGIEIVSFLLQSCKKKNIVFSLYKSLYNLFQKISDSKLKEHFFNDLLTNIDIWIYSQGEDHLKIIRNWRQYLFPNNMNLVSEERSFRWAMNLMRIYYYYSECEPDIQRERPLDLDLPQIRKNFLVLAVNLASNNFNSSDLCYLICTITGCADSSQQMDYLRLLNELLKKGNVSPLLRAKESYGYIKILQYLSNSKNKGISIVSMQTLINAYRSQFLTPESDRMVDILLHQISKEMISREYFDMLLTVVKKDTPELFPIMAWMAMNLGEEVIKIMYDELPPSENYIHGCAWCVWPIITMFRFTAIEARQIASFLIRCSVMNFEQIYAFIDTIGIVMKRTTDDMKTLLIEELLKYINSSETINENYLRIYYTFAHHYLFFRAQPNEKDKLDNLDKMFKDSPFADQLPEIPQVRQFQELINILRTRPKFNSDGSDRYSPDMAQKALQIIAPRANEEEVINNNKNKQDNPIPIPTKKNKEGENAIPLPQFRPTTVTFGGNIGSGQQQPPPRRNLLRRNSIFTITKATESNDAPQQRKSLRLAPPAANIRRRGARAIISSQMNYFLANDSLAIFSELFFNPIHYFFGIRQGSLASKSEYMINWLDKDIAIEFLKTYAEKPMPEFESTIVIICAFLIFQDPYMAMTALSGISVDKQETTGSLAFYDRNAVRAKQNPMFNRNSSEQIAYESNNFLNNFPSQIDENINMKWKKIIDQIKDYEDKNSLSANETFNLITPSLVAITTDAIADFVDSISQLKTQCNKYWQQLWHVISIERAPWNKSLPPNLIQQSHYRRDLSLCYAGFSPKLKTNYKFDIHLEASVVRDTGDEETGKSKTEELKEQLKTMYEQGSEAYSLFEISDQSSMKEKSNSVFTASKCIIELPCEIIKIDKTYEDCSFLLLENSIVLTIIDQKSTVIDYNSVKCIFPRTRCHHMTAIEIFTNDGLSYFVNFPNFSSAQVLKSFRDKVKIQPCDFKASLQQSKMTEKWQHREISNFQYLMTLNLHSGRTTNDLSQYPVFPWIISDYKSEELDLNDHSVYRDLSKPIGAVNNDRLEELKDKAEQLKGMGMTPYLYSSCFSCPFVVCLFMIRLEPFTSLHIDIQGGHFDVSSRIFSSVQEAYKLCNINHNDYRELIPEFFMMPEFLVNRDRFDLGMVGDKKIDDVELPKWAHNDPYEFIYKNRKALESEYVTQNLNNWIDLIWGDKQRGEKAWKADNVYIREMYADIWDVTPLDDVNQRANVEAILTHVGQIPPLLFDKPHPIADPLPQQNITPIFDEIKMPVTNSIMCIDLKQVDKNIVAFLVDKNNKFYSFTYDPLNLPKLSSNKNSSSGGFGSNSSGPMSIQSRSRTNSLQIRSNQPENGERKIGSIGLFHKFDNSMTESDRSLESNSTSSSFMGITKQHRSRTVFQKLNLLCDSPVVSSDDESILLSDDRTGSSGNSRIASLNSFPESGNFLSQNSFTSSTSIASMMAQKNMKKKIKNGSIYSFNGNNTFIFSGDKTHDIFKVSKSSEVSKLGFKHRAAIKLIASDFKWTVVADADSVVSIYCDEELKFTIPLFSSAIKCLTLCSLYHLLICGTKDGFLLFCSLTSGTVIKTVNLNGMKPIKLIITPSWGFVVAYIIEIEEGKINHHLKLFTVNGDLIRSTKIDASVQSWKAFSNFKGFDYIVMANSNNECFLFEAFYLNCGNPFYSADKPISSICFVNSCSCVVLADDAGHLNFVSAAVPE